MSERLLQMMQMKPKCLRQYKNHFKISSQLSDSWLTFTPKKESCSGGSAFHCLVAQLLELRSNHWLGRRVIKIKSKQKIINTIKSKQKKPNELVLIKLTTAWFPSLWLHEKEYHFSKTAAIVRLKARKMYQKTLWTFHCTTSSSTIFRSVI